MKNLSKTFLLKRLLFILLLSFSLLSHAQITEWTKNWPNNVKLDKHTFTPGIGHILIGSYNGSADFDLGNGTAISSSVNSAMFILKLDTAGVYQWSSSIPSASSSANLEFSNVKVNPLGEIYIVGTAPSIDLDPSANLAQYVQNSWMSSCFLAKYSSSGQYLWHESIPLPTPKTLLELDQNGDVILVSTELLNDSITYSVGSDNLTLGIPGETVIAKYAASGAGLWAKHLKKTNVYNPYNYVRSSALTITNNGEILIAGTFKDTIDFDPSLSSTHFITGFAAGTSLNYCSFFTLKLNSSGDFVFAKNQGDTYDIGTIKDINLDSQGKIYEIGKATIGGNYLQPYNFVKCYSSIGDSLWSKSIEGVDVDFNHLEIDTNDNLFATGNFTRSSFVLDSSANHSVINGKPNSQMGFVVSYNSIGNFRWVNQEYDSLNNSIWGFTEFTDLSLGSDGAVYALNTHHSGLLKIYEDSCSINFSLYVNDYSDINCTEDGEISLATFGGVGPITYTWSNGISGSDTAYFTTPGIYSVHVTELNGCEDSLTILVNGPITTPGFDLVSTINNSFFVPGQVSTVNLNVSNLSCDSVTGTATFVLDNNLTILTSSLTPDLIIGDSLFWNFTNLTWDTLLNIQLTVETDTNAIIGDSVELSLNASPSIGDLNPLNNLFVYNSIISSSYHPIDIAVFPMGKCAEGFIAPDQKLIYTVRFQNTGTYQAFNISILDSLSPDMDLNTLRVLASSHSLHTEILSNNVVKFVFNNINLPDSNANEPGSHGYLIFEIDPLTGLSNGTQIENRVGIYFDYNAPIYTNTVSNTIYTGNLSALNCFLGLEEDLFTNEVIIYPNPASNSIYIDGKEQLDENSTISFLDIHGRVVLKVNYQDGQSINISDLKNGVYFINVHGKHNRILRKFVKN